jgi:hypothetical protein
VGLWQLLYLIKYSDGGILQSGLQSFWALSTVRYSEKKKRFGNWMYFHFQVDRYRRTYPVAPLTADLPLASQIPGAYALDAVGSLRMPCHTD